MGNLVNTIDGVGNKATFVYDALDRQTQTIDPRSGTTTTVYDAASNVVNLIDAAGNKTTFTLDALNRTVQQTDALGHTASAAFDAAGRLTSTTDRDGRVRNFSYDNAGRMTGETWVVSGSTVNTLTFTYDARNDLLTAADGHSAYTMTYDALNRLATQQGPFGGMNLTMTYDAASNRTVLQDSYGGVATSVYDAANRLTSVQFGGTGQTPVRADFAYSARDQLTGITRYSDLAGSHTVATTNFTYDVGGRLTNLQHLNPTPANIANYTYAYDTASRITSETRNGTTKTFTYDTTNQVTNDGTATYTYDLAGNRTMSGYTTGTGNELTGDGTFTYAYDNEGNQITKTNTSTGEQWTFSYDLNNRLVSAKDASGTGTTLALATYVYDVFGNRIEEDVWTQSSGTTTVTRFVYDPGTAAGQGGWTVLADLNGSNQLQTRYVTAAPAGQAPLARISSGGTVAWYLTDAEGSVRDLVDNTGTVQDHLDYDAFGNVLTETAPTFGDRFKFQGMQLDVATGLYVTWGRDYDPKTARWTSQDPLSFGAGDSNLYRFVSNDPTAYNDPSGLRGNPFPQGQNDPAKQAAYLNSLLNDPRPWVRDWARKALALSGSNKTMADIIAQIGVPSPPIPVRTDPGWLANAGDWAAARNADMAYIFGFWVLDAYQHPGEFFTGLKHGSVLVANAFTLRQWDDVRNRADELVAENGGLYVGGQWAAYGGAAALYLAIALRSPAAAGVLLRVIGPGAAGGAGALSLQASGAIGIAANVTGAISAVASGVAISDLIISMMQHPPGGGECGGAPSSQNLQEEQAMLEYWKEEIEAAAQAQNQAEEELAWEEFYYWARKYVGKGGTWPPPGL